MRLLGWWLAHPGIVCALALVGMFAALVLLPGALAIVLMWGLALVAVASYGQAVNAAWPGNRPKAVLLVLLPSIWVAGLVGAWLMQGTGESGALAVLGVFCLAGAPFAMRWATRRLALPTPLPLPGVGPRRSSRRVGLTVSIVLGVAVVAFIGWRVQRLGVAEGRVRAFCGQAAIGGPIEALDAGARAAGLRVLRFSLPPEPGGPPPAHRLVADDGWGTARWGCVLDNREGSVVRK